MSSYSLHYIWSFLLWKTSLVLYLCRVVRNLVCPVPKCCRGSSWYGASSTSWGVVSTYLTSCIPFLLTTRSQQPRLLRSSAVICGSRADGEWDSCRLPPEFLWHHWCVQHWPILHVVRCVNTRRDPDECWALKGAMRLTSMSFKFRDEKTSRELREEIQGEDK